MNKDDYSELKQRLLLLVESIDRNLGTAHPETQSNVSPGQEMVIALLAVCRNNMRGIYFLLKEDHAEQARIIERTLLIDSMRLLYFVKHPDQLEELRVAFAFGSIRDQRNLVLEMEKHFGAEDNDIAVLKTQLDQQEDALRDEASSLSLEEAQLTEYVRILMKADELFKASPQPEGYAMFRHASHVVHTSTLALEMHKQRAEDGTIQLMWGGSPGNVLRVGLMSAQLFLFGYRAAAEMLGWDTIDTIRSFFDFTFEQLEHLRKDAGIESMEALIGGVALLEEGEAQLQDSDVDGPTPLGRLPDGQREQ